MKYLLLLACLNISYQAQALPINFGTTQGKIEYHEIITEHFRVYFDSRVPHEGLLTAKALEGVRPLMESWLAIQRDPDEPLRVVTSPVTYNASFANFIFDAIELQTSGQNIRDLTWHEYVHTLTYEHYQNILSPPGSIYYLLWMPAWFLEGMAEALTVSVGSDFQSGMERFFALTNHWPSYDSLHSLYLKPTWANQGYATVGGFFSWMMRHMQLDNIQNRKKPKKPLKSLAKLLQTFRKETMPWMLPFSGFMPMNESLRMTFQRNGQELYKRYKQEARAYWKTASPYPMLSATSESIPWNFFSRAPLRVFGNHLVMIHKLPNQKGSINRMKFAPQSGFAYATEPIDISVAKDVIHSTYIRSSKLHATLVRRKSVARTKRNAIAIAFPSKKKTSHYRVLYEGNAIYNLFESQNFFGWFEKSLLTFKICHIAKKSLKKHYLQHSLITPKCQNISEGAWHGQPIGFKTTWDAKTQFLNTKEIWIQMHESTILGDRYRILIWDGKDGSLSRKTWHPFAKPVSVAFSGNQTWVLTTDRTSSYLSQVNKSSSCLNTIRLSDWILGAWGLKSGEMVLQLQEKNGSSLKKIHPKSLTKYPCFTPEPHSSPLLDGMRLLSAKRMFTTGNMENYLRSSSMPSLEEMILRTHHWKPKYFQEMARKNLEKDGTTKDPNQTIKQTNSIFSSRFIQNYYTSYKHLTKKVLSHKERHTALLKAPNFANSTTQSVQPNIAAKNIKPYEFRWSSPVFFPWLGPNDDIIQVGAIAWPLVDDLQNHRVYATVLVGIKSLYPNVNVNYTNERFTIPIQTNIFKQQKYNGRYAFKDDQGKDRFSVAYYDELGGDISISEADAIDLGHFYQLGYNLGYRFSQLKTSSGPEDMQEGLQHLPFASLSLTRFLPWRFSLSLGAGVKYAPGFLNQNFDYIKNSYSARLRKQLLQKTSLTLGVDYGTTRGEKPLMLKEYYTAIQIFIPGSGNITNKFHTSIYGQGWLLNTNIQGDTYIRTSANFTTPIISQLDTQFWIFYAEKLNWNVFTNWGSIWSDEDEETINTYPFILAYASTIDLHLENKGVEFHVGLGVGRLHKYPLKTPPPVDFYFNFGFKAFL